MGKLNNSVLILGEGPTEFYYLKSLADTFKHITIKPDYPKHTNLLELEQKINRHSDRCVISKSMSAETNILLFACV